MATEDEVGQALLKGIAEGVVAAGKLTSGLSRARALEHLAEAYAWTIRPNQPHGGSTVAES